MKRVDLFCYRHPRFGINNLMMIICIGNIAVWLFSAMDTTGMLRELLAFNTVWGNPVTLPFTFSVMALPFGGFVLLGFLAAAVRRYREHLNKPGSGEEE